MYRPDLNSEYCQNYYISFFTYNFNNDLKKFRTELPKYSFKIEEKEYSNLLNSLPKNNKERSAPDFKFQYVNGILNNENKNYNIKLKNRGETSYNWANEKKSYTVNFKDYYKQNDKLLFIIPDKRAYAGEYLMNKLAKILNIYSLESHFGFLDINGRDYGIYYVSEDFDKHFLAKRSLPEANIYNGDPYKIPSTLFDINLLNKGMIASNIKAYEKDHDKDTEYFLSVIRLENSILEKKWKYYFDEENLTRMLALTEITGTAHYIFKNMVFYINPANGKIYFFPWDFMNYTHTGHLDREDLKSLPNNYISINGIFTKLLDIPEIRNKKNKIIYGNSEKLISYLDEFNQYENITLAANFLNNQTTEIYVGDGNRGSFINFFKIPVTITNNIKYLKEKISETKINGSIIYENYYNKILLSSNTFSGIKIKKFILSETRPEEVNEVSINNSTLKESKDFIMKALSNGSTEISLNRQYLLNPKLNYKEEYASLIKLEPSYMIVKIGLKGAKTLNSITVEAENITTTLNKKFNFSRNDNFKDIIIKDNFISEEEFSNPLLQKVNDSDNKYKFVSNDIKIHENLIIPKGRTLIIDPGTKIFLSKGISIISYGRIIANGTSTAPIIFTSLNPDEQWGVIGLVQEKASGEFSNCIFEKGGDAHINNIYFSGMLSLYYADAIINNCKFQQANWNSGDDALNVKYGLASVKNSYFYSNKFDGLDFDFVKNGSVIENNYFLENGDDGIDISGSNNMIIRKNKIKNSEDKGISIGEMSDVEISNNIIENSRFGIAIKDSSLAKIINNNIINNVIGITSYNKKEISGGGKAFVFNTLFKNNKQDFGLELIEEGDKRFGNKAFLSKITVSNSVYKLTKLNENEVIMEAKTKTVSKKKLLMSALRTKIDEDSSPVFLLNSAEEDGILSKFGTKSSIGIIEKL